MGANNIIDYDLKYYYKTNYDLIKDLYDSEYGRGIQVKIIKGNKGVLKYLIAKLINDIYVDPDKSDKNLYVSICKNLNNDVKEKKFNLSKNGKNIIHSIENYKIQLSLDGTCSWKNLFNIYKNDREWLEKYKEIRSSVYGQVLWPVHKSPNINTARASKLNDRIDYTLFDIKQYFVWKCQNNTRKCENHNNYEINKNKIKLFDVYDKKKNTNLWLNYFISSSNDKNNCGYCKSENVFKSFINIMKLNAFVETDEQGNYNVIDLLESNIGNSHKVLITNLDNIAETNETYINNLVKLIYKKEYLLSKL